jgi:DNA-binding beta-propeller fold protein YncE
VPKIPGCSSTAAPAKQLSKVTSSADKLGGNPFSATVTPDGRFTFVTLGNSLAVLSNGRSLAPALVHTIALPGADKGAAITPDGKYLLLASGSGAKVISVADAEQGSAVVVGTLASPHGRGAVQVALTPKGKFAFVTLQSSGGMAVFNLKQALASNFAQSGFIGIVPTGVEPVGVTESPSGNWLYMTSIEKVKTSVPSEGLLSVVSVAKAEARPAKAVVAQVIAGCSPVRVITSSDGSVVWVTARESDALLGFSAAKLRSGQGHALIARVDVGVGPIGLAFAADGKRIVVANSDLKSIPGAVPSLSVVSTSSALAGKPALLGLIKSGVLPRQLTTEGKALLVTDYGSGQLQAINLADLP